MLGKRNLVKAGTRCLVKKHHPDGSWSEHTTTADNFFDEPIKSFVAEKQGLCVVFFRQGWLMAVPASDVIAIS